MLTQHYLSILVILLGNNRFSVLQIMSLTEWFSFMMIFHHKFVTKEGMVLETKWRKTWVQLHLSNVIVFINFIIVDNLKPNRWTSFPTLQSPLDIWWGVGVDSSYHIWTNVSILHTQWMNSSIIHDNVCKLIHKKCHPKSYHSDIIYHMILNIIFGVLHMQIPLAKVAKNINKLTFNILKQKFLNW